MGVPAIAEKQVLTDGAMAGTNTLTSLPSNIQGFAYSSYQMVWTGGTGTFSIEVSNNWKPTNPNDQSVGAGTWTPLTLAVTMEAPANSAGDEAVDLSDLPFKWVRLKYTNAANSGTLQVYYVAKRV